jgi:hypothetical protein
VDHNFAEKTLTSGWIFNFAHMFSVTTNPPHSTQDWKATLRPKPGSSAKIHAAVKGCRGQVR